MAARFQSLGRAAQAFCAAFLAVEPVEIDVPWRSRESRGWLRSLWRALTGA